MNPTVYARVASNMACQVKAQAKKLVWWGLPLAGVGK